jgi:UDP-4-amino-4-deoxy-L-arabinose-oxoglutarate aminotransferase
MSTTPERVEFFRHTLGDEEAASWRQVLETVCLTLGPQVAAFEQELGAFLLRGREPGDELHGPRHVVGTNSCTNGLLVALRALGLEPGDEVITTPMTFVSTTNAILHLGGKPVLVDVDPATGLLDPAAVRAAIGPRTRGILPVHLYGQLADMRAFRALADTHGLFLLEDSAHGTEMERDGVRPGDLGDAAVFSFYATKTLTSGDGGAVVTKRADLAERMRRLRNHGVSKAAADRHGGLYQHWDMVELGFKANLTDLDAAILRPQLPRALAQRSARESVDLRYRALLPELAPRLFAQPDSAVPPLVTRVGQSTHHLFTVHVPAERRDAILTALGARGIGVAVNYRAIHTLSYLEKTLSIPRGALPHAEAIGDRTVSLPQYPALAEAQQIRVVQALEESVGA